MQIGMVMRMEVVKFKKSLFGGFRRRDVLQFIEEFAAEKADEIHDLTEKVNQLQAKLNDTQTELQTRCAERNQIATQREELAEKAKQQEERLAVMEEDLKKASSESKASLQLLKERDVKIAFLEDKAQKLTIKLEACESKSRKYDKLSVEIGEMILEAKQSAEVIIRQAEHRSAELTAETDAAVDNLSADLQCFLQQLGQIKTNLHTMLGNVDSQIETIENSLYTAKDRIKNFQSSKPAPRQQDTTEQDTPISLHAAASAPKSASSEKEPDVVGFSKAPAKPASDVEEQRQKPNFFR